MLKNILNSGFVFTDNEYELKTKYILLNSMMFLLAISLAIVGSFRLLTSYYTQGLIDFFATSVGIVLIFLLRKSKKGQYKPVAYFMALISAALIIISYYTSNGVININTWFIALIIPIFFILGYRIAMIMALFFMIIIAMLNLNYIQTDVINTIYGYVPLFLSVVFLHIYEFTKVLRDSNNNLEQKVKEKTLERTQVLEEQKKKSRLSGTP